jgi:hypothetical protein
MPFDHDFGYSFPLFSSLLVLYIFFLSLLQKVTMSFNFTYLYLIYECDKEFNLKLEAMGGRAIVIDN